MSLLAVFTLLVGCFEDKGNYDYKNINRITIKTLTAEAGWTSSFGSVLEIKPELEFETGSGDEKNLEFQWSINDVTREGWDKRDFYWVADTTISTSLKFSIKDKLTDVVYTETFNLNIYPEFSPSGGGVVILSEKDGNSQLSFISFDLTTNYATKRTTVKSAKIYPNVYEERQKQILGQGPIAIHEHFTRKSASVDNTQYLVLQNSGPTDVVSTTLTKDIDLNSAFIGGAYPPAVTAFKKAAFMDFTDVLVDQDGKLYSRIKLVKELFHSSYFFLDPLKYEGKELRNCSLINGYYRDAKMTLIHDKDNKRFLAICDGVTSSYDNPGQENAGKIMAVPAAPQSEKDIPEGFIPLDNFGDYELVNGGYFRAESGYYFSICYFMVFKNSKGEYFGQSFYLDRADYNTTDLLVKNAKISKLNLPKEPNIVYPTQFLNSGTSDVFIAIDNELYRVDRLDQNLEVKKHLTFNSKIVSINTECFNNYWGVVALENGEVHLIDVTDAKNLDENEKIIYSLPEDVDLGEIKHAIIRTGGNSW